MHAKQHGHASGCVSLQPVADGPVNDSCIDCPCAAGERPLYQVLEQQQAQVGGNLMGSDHTYVIPGAKAGPGKKCAPHEAPCHTVMCAACF